MLYQIDHPDSLVPNFQIPTNRAGLIEYRCHPFWSQKYCPSHEHDNTARCCSCERLEVSIKTIEISSQVINYSSAYQARMRLRFLPLVLTTIPHDFTVLECKIHFFGRWAEFVPRMHGICYHGHRGLPTALPFHPRLLWRDEHEDRSTNSHASSWKTGAKWSYCWGEACNIPSFTLFFPSITIKQFIWSVLIFCRASITCLRLEVYAFLKSRLSPVYVFVELQ